MPSFDNDGLFHPSRMIVIEFRTDPTLMNRTQEKVTMMQTVNLLWLNESDPLAFRNIWSISPFFASD
jgi:hypothetical protein